MDKNLIPKLRFHIALDGLTESELQHVASFGELKELVAGEILMKPDQMVDALYLVMKGRLRVSGNFGNVIDHTLHLVGPGQHYGALGIVINQPLPCTVQADQPTLVLRIPREDLSQLLEQYPRIRQNLSNSIGKTLRSSLLEQNAARMPRFVACLQFSKDGRDVVGRMARRLSGLDESVALLTDTESVYANQKGFAESPIQVESLKRDGKYVTVEQRAELLRDVSECSRVIVDVDGPAAVKDLEFLVDSCDITLWIASEQQCGQAIELIKKVATSSPARKDKMCFVCLPNENEMVSSSVRQYVDLVDREFKVPVRTDGTYDRLQHHGVERIVHHLRDVHLGIALGGGAARGMAHLGVLKVLEEAGIFVDMMSGTSAGALTGVQYCAGYDADFCINAFENDLTPGPFFRMLPKGDAWYLLSKYRTRAWDKMLAKYLHDWSLEQLLIPFKGVSVDLVAGQQVIHQGRESAIDTICASINLPGISAPICRDGMALIDGGTLNVLPADVLVNAGCNYVVAVNVSSKIKQEFGGNRPDTPTGKMRTPGIRSTLARERVVQDRSMNAIGARPANFVVEPDISAYALTDFAKTREIAEKGRAAADEKINELRASLMQLDAKLFAKV